MRHPRPSLLRDLQLPAALILLCIVPLAAGAVRLAWLAGLGDLPLGRPALMDAPAPLVTHVATSIAFVLLGALQLSDGLRRRFPRWHVLAGRVAALSAIGLAASGFWLLGAVGPAPGDAPALQLFRSLAGLALAIFAALGWDAIRRRDVAAHRSWMIRAFAIAAGTGLQPFLVILWSILAGPPSDVALALVLGAGWAISLAVAECRLRPRLALHPA